jgi:hypothetical protein
VEGNHGEKPPVLVKMDAGQREVRYSNEGFEGRAQDEMENESTSERTSSWMR